MGRKSSKAKAQKRVLDEIKKQLLLQAERWGRKDYYTPQKLEEMILNQCYKIKGDLLEEKANLEYEMRRVDSDKKETLIKLEKINVYLKRADRAKEMHQNNINRWIEKLVGDREKTQFALGRIFKKPKVSVMVGD